MNAFYYVPRVPPPVDNGDLARELFHTQHTNKRDEDKDKDKAPAPPLLGVRPTHIPLPLSSTATLDVDQRRLLGMVSSWLAPLAILIIAYAPPIHPGARALLDGSLTPPNPLKCEVGTCWDGAHKHGFPKCTGGSNQLVRGVEVPLGAQSCYHAVYFNVEPTTAKVLCLLAAWIVVVGRSAEHLLVIYLEGAMRWGVFAAIAASVFPAFYSFNALFIYMNEFHSTWLPSQLFFTVTEVVSTVALLSSADVRKPVSRRALILGGGINLLHLVQLSLDEGYKAKSVYLATLSMARNFFLLIGDVAALACSVWLVARHDGESVFAWKTWKWRWLITFVGILVFHAFFAGPLSFKFW